jgi:hypothetical protein
MVFPAPESQTASAPEVSGTSQSDSSDLWVRPVSEEYRNYYLKSLSNPNRRHVELVIENHLPKLHFDDEEQPEVVFEEEVYVMDIFDVPKIKTRDDVLEQNRRLLEQLMLEDPEIAALLRSKRVKKIQQVRSDEIEEDAFYDYLLSYDVRHYDYPHPSPPPTPERKRTGFPTKLEPIPRLGSRRSHPVSKGSRSCLIIEFEDKQKVRMSQITTNLIHQVAQEGRTLPDTVKPGWTFQQALSSGPKVHAPARSDEDWQNFYK